MCAHSFTRERKEIQFRKREVLLEEEMVAQIKKLKNHEINSLVMNGDKDDESTHFARVP